MRLTTQQPLFGWEALEDSPSLQTIRALLEAVPDAKLPAALHAWRGKGRDDYPVGAAGAGRVVWDDRDCRATGSVLLCVAAARPGPQAAGMRPAGAPGRPGMGVSRRWPIPAAGQTRPWPPCSLTRARARL